MKLPVTITPWDHPHIHGEHRSTSCQTMTRSGSPPYTWGALRRTRLRVQRSGITPIYMGSTRTSWLKAVVVRDHPHIHGEHYNRVSLYSAKSGSPPYTWGALHVCCAIPLTSRITPIYMGSTDNKCRKSHSSRDHPHIHGEHRTLNCSPAIILGSPPYTWGAPYRNPPNRSSGGITPIYMGSTLNRPYSSA